MRNLDNIPEGFVQASKNKAGAEEANRVTRYVIENMWHIFFQEILEEGEFYDSWLGSSTSQDNLDCYMAETGGFMCNNCGGGFDRDEIATDECGDDYCSFCLGL